MTRTFTSLRHCVEKLLEAEYFLARSMCAYKIEFQFELNAFLSAARNVTFVLQSSMSRVPQFDRWYEVRQTEMNADTAMKFFLKLRNVSQKQGPIPFVGSHIRTGGWTYRFVEDTIPLPQSVMSEDIRLCCARHLIKLGSLLRQCCAEFPFYCCPYLALTEEGMSRLGYTWHDAEIAAGLGSGWTSVIDLPADQKLRYLRREVEPLDIDAIERIATGNLQSADGPIDFMTFTDDKFADSLAKNMAESRNPRVALVGALMRRAQQLD